MMPTQERPTDFRARSGRGLGVRLLVFVGVALLLVMPVAAATSPATSWEGAPVSWSNGFVLCAFAPSTPTVGVSAVARAQTGLSSTVGSLAELTAAGTTVATSSLSSIPWTATNFSTENAYDLGYTVHAPVASASVPSTLLGSVDVRVDFVLPAYVGSRAGPTDTVAVSVLVSNWSWQATGDHLVLTLAFWPSHGAEEHLVIGSLPSSLLSSVATSSGTTLEQMVGSTSAIANPGSSAPTNVSATPSVVGNASEAAVSVVFGTTAGAFSALSYGASVHVLLPTTVAGIPTVDLVVVGGVAALISILVAAGAHRVRRRPSDLTYVEDEEA